MTIRVKIELMPVLKRLRKERNFELELSDDATVKTMLENVGFKENELEHLRIFVNNKLAHLDKVLKDGDDIWVGVVVGGGVKWNSTIRKLLKKQPCFWRDRPASP
ncbi:MAG: MoaD/ThiS family protein [Candidatus Hadarchaeaceae archaeon]